MNNPSPLEQLAAFAICVTIGALSVMALAAYTKVVGGKTNAPKD